MLQAILIVAYRDINAIMEIINSFTPSKYLFFIHLNKKSKILNEDITTLKEINNVKCVEQKYATYWGGFNHLKAILYLSEEALKHDVDYIHLISGQDYPIKSSSEIESILLNNNELQFINYFEIPFKLWDDENFGFDRLDYYHLNDYLSSNKKLGRIIIKILVEIQKKLSLKRKWPSDFPKLYGGDTWWTLTHSCLQYVVEYRYRHPEFYDRFSNTRIPEEIYFQTIIMNSPFARSVKKDHLRYIMWETRNGSRPAVLDDTDFDLLLSTDKLFARKFISPISDNLKKRIASLLLKN